MVGWSHLVPGYFYAIFDYDYFALGDGDIRQPPEEGAGIDGELLPTVEDLMAASWGAIDWNGQDELIRDLLWDPYRRSRYADGRIHALVERALGSVA
jgi:hypothetical protein